MKIKKITLENVLSFREKTAVQFGDISILIGPNGGGKTNLLDIVADVVQFNLLHTWIKKPAVQRPLEYQFERHVPPRTTFTPHFERSKNPQVLDLTIQITQHDVENIERLTSELLPKADELAKTYTNLKLKKILVPELSQLRPGEEITFEFRNGNLTNSSEKLERLLRYFNNFDMFQQVLETLGGEELYKPFLYLPAMRTHGGLNTYAQLASDDIFTVRGHADAATSRQYNGPSHFVSLKLARIHRQLEALGGELDVAFDKHAFVSSLRTALAQLGFSLALVTEDALKNIFRLNLMKSGASFNVDSASSGERELLNFVFAIYGMDVRQSVVLIDEPELHLHPRWQIKVMALFEALNRETGNQFIMATHSPSFVSPTTVKYISRVFIADNASRVIRLKDGELPQQRHLFNIVNSQKNERLFFADKVILVEGISDRLVFERIADI